MENIKAVLTNWEPLEEGRDETGSGNVFCTGGKPETRIESHGPKRSCRSG